MALRFLRFRKTIIGCGFLVTGFTLDKTDFFDSDLAYVRIARVALMSAKMAVDYKYTITRLRNFNEDDDEYKKRMGEAHLRGAHRLLDLCRSNRGVFIKLVQHAASLQFALPLEYFATLAAVRSVAQESPIDELRLVFREDLGKELEDVFTDFNETPLAITSLAQIHKARLRSNGAQVAVKIQHGEVEKKAWWDLAIIEQCLHLAHAIFPEIQLLWLYEECRRNLPFEVDFTCAAHNADACRAIYGQLGFVYVPHIYREHSSPRVLTMEHVQGVHVDDFAGIELLGIRAPEIGRKLGELYSAMLFKYGFCHYAPTPHSLLVNKIDGKTYLIILNHDLYMQLENAFRFNFCELWKASVLSDNETIKQCAYRMGTDRLFEHFGFTLGDEHDEDEKLEQLDITTYDLKLIASFVLVLKINDTLAAVEKKLNMHETLDVFIEMSKRCIRQIYRNDITHVASFWKRVSARLELIKVYCMLSLYEYFLAFKDSFRSVIFARKLPKIKIAKSAPPPAVQVAV